jgi:ubiquinone/menaquinone biosynthesis C-methylase UbiE
MLVLGGLIERSRQLLEWIKKRGLLWTILYIFRSMTLKLSQKILRKLEELLISVERQKFLTGDRTISSLSHTLEDNLKTWNNHDWSKYGEEWTEQVRELKGLEPNKWKDMVVNQIMMKYLNKNLTLLEVGPGAGRWTKILQKKAYKIIIADISEECLRICKDRFQEYSNIEYYLIRDGRLNFLDDESIDYIWSYDVFVHINPTDTEQYIAAFQRILKSGGIAIIHHPGAYTDEVRTRRKAFRSWMDGQFFAHLVVKYGMKIVEQDDALTHKLGDLITVFMKP